MNQYRCETCKNHIYERETYCDFCITKPLIKYRIVPNEMYVINHLGCASHSDFQSEQFTEDELSDLFIIVDADIERHGKRTSVVKLLDKIEELRQAGE